MSDATRPPQGGAVTYTVEVLSGVVRRNADPVRLTSREREIAIAVAVQRAPISVEALAEMLYPDRDPEHGCSMAKVYVHRVRRRVDPDLIVTRDGGYCLGSAARVDVANPEAQLKALSWTPYLTPEEAERMRVLARRLRTEIRTPLLRYEWYAAMVTRLRRIGHDIALTLARKAFEAGMVREAIGIARELTYDDECDEEAWEYILRGQLALGQRGAALRAFRLYESALAKELQTIPSPSISGLFAS